MSARTMPTHSMPNHPGSPSVEVAVLGPVEVRGAVRPFARAWTLDLVVYLAMHPRGVVNEAWVTALWPDQPRARATVHSTASAARRALGRSASGDHLPHERGRLRVAPSVATDWSCLRTLAGRPEPGGWAAALDLVRGRPFDGLRSADWTVLEGHAAEIEATVVDLAIRLSTRHLGDGDGPAAARACRRGLRAAPFDERLYRQLLRAADLQGDPAGVETVMAEVVHVMGGPPRRAAAGGERGPWGVLPAGAEVLHPQTVALYRELSRGRGGAGRRLIRM